MNIAAWIAVGALGAAIVSRIAEPRKAENHWDEASTWFGLVKECAAWAVIVMVLS